MTMRASLPDVPVGLVSLTDRVLPHLFPSTDQDVFAATLERSLGIEKPPPRSSFATGATSLNALATLRGLRYFTPKSTQAARDRPHRRREPARLERTARRPLSPVARDRGRLRPVLERGRAGLLTRRTGAAVHRGPVGPAGARPARGLHAGGGLLGGSDRRRFEQGPRAPRRAARASSRGTGRGSSRSRPTSPRRRSFLSASCCGDAIGSERFRRAARLGTMAPRPPGSRSRPCTRSPGSRARATACGLAAERTARTASSPDSGPPRSPARARRSRHRVAVARSTSVPCCRYHSTPTARSRSGRARSSSAPACSAATKSLVVRFSGNPAPGICTS